MNKRGQQKGQLTTEKESAEDSYLPIAMARSWGQWERGGCLPTMTMTVWVWSADLGVLLLDPNDEQEGHLLLSDSLMSNALQSTIHYCHIITEIYADICRVVLTKSLWQHTSAHAQQTHWHTHTWVQAIQLQEPGGYRAPAWYKSRKNQGQIWIYLAGKIDQLHVMPSEFISA